MIPFLDLRAQYASIKPELDDAVLRVLASGQYVLGEEVAGFEREFAAYCGTSHAVAVNTGTSALHLALLAAGIGPGDEVITVPFTFVASVAAIRYTGAHPVFVDIDPHALTMDPAQLEAAITPRTKAIVPVHLYGRMADMAPIMEIADRHGLPVIEDACQAHGADFRDKRAGSIGHSGCFSFYPGKNLGACGEGGIVVTNDAATAAMVATLRDWGQEQRYHHRLKGFNFRMDGIQGAVLRVKLRHLEHWTAARRSHARLYDALLADIETIRSPANPADGRHVYHVYAIRSVDRDSLRRSLDVAGIQTGLHYPIPVHLQPAHADLGHRVGDFPVSEKAANEVLSLPLYPEMTAGQVAEVVSVIRAATMASSEVRVAHVG
ncbi:MULTISPECIES: DegT/DnrJ/EryC1/StrS family aminotransferase [Phyllobacteriaceae]|jgi:dTDP-4-amino-4,6-dideoxygalactose transaminase|uniref:Erythromycin biosynthesis sensory transduction protein eryC1 n=1 Tax=Mesorhizobium hungaricum TaxID=1566387 RepID=A0A1C2DVP1_9HYPH|nr:MULTISPECIES: DegT/DnrJ/EryC1/StrS family aminotransferase [Mesorhizobium]MBN9234011.1 DegT/DnrJ/EryC1/StrS family aminotransferase [Mesorhizobium sp.]MDQ0331543.1 dTDP-4-amino-4,6-dideoxygalactose transaminase [Mesorhizobium sp. YL-MeA3-2017]OCX18831.1 erythromycin biosynthesis sensory transduction protein eryC1 [Mesorhizobium hungaricum]